MSAPVKDIFVHFGWPIVGAAVVLSLVTWALVPFNAAPGSRVSVLFGLAEYTKKSPNEVVLNADNLDLLKGVNEPDIEDSEANELQVPDAPLEALSIDQISNVSEENAAEILEALREDKNLRPLTPSESDRLVEELPGGLYFYLFAWSLDFDGTSFETAPRDLFVKSINGKMASRFQTRRRSYVEIHKEVGGDIQLILYMNETSLAQIGTLDGISQHKIQAAVTPWKKATVLISLPIERIYTSRVREVELAERDDLYVLDIVIR
jgi:hypothetical protein